MSTAQPNSKITFNFDTRKTQLSFFYISEVWIRIRIFQLLSKNSKKNLDFYSFLTSFGLFIFESDVNVPSKSNMQENFILKISFLLASCRSMMKIAGSESGSISQRNGSAGSTPTCHGSDPLI